jgi:ABC-type transport system substrate-binding protein
LTEYAYDPDAAMALLEEMGWKDTDGDGVREAQGVEGIAMARCWSSNGNLPPPRCVSSICRSSRTT